MLDSNNFANNVINTKRFALIVYNYIISTIFCIKVNRFLYVHYIHVHVQYMYIQVYILYMYIYIILYTSSQCFIFPISDLHCSYNIQFNMIQCLCVSGNK